MAKEKKFVFNKEEVGKRLRDFRKKYHFVQDDLSKFLGFTRSGYASIERGTYGTRIEILANIILFYQENGVRIDFEEIIGLKPMIRKDKTDKDSQEIIAELREKVGLQKQVIEGLNTQLDYMKKYGANGK